MRSPVVRWNAAVVSVFAAFALAACMDRGSKLPAKTELSGVVTDEDGNPINGVPLFLREPAFGGESARTRTSSDGHFTFRAPPGDAFIIGVLPNADFPAQQVNARAGDSTIRIVIQRGVRARGRVVGDGGAPLKDFSVNGLRFHSEDGTFVISTRYGEPVQAHVSAPGFADETLTAPFHWKETELGDIQLSHGREVDGEVVDSESGAPVARATVYAIILPNAEKNPDNALATETKVLTDDSGHFVLKEVSAKANAVVIEHPRYLKTSVPLSPTQLHEQAALTRGGSLELVLFDSKGERWTRSCQAYATGPDGQRTPKSCEKGRLRFVSLASGDWKFEMDNYESHFAPLVLKISGDRDASAQWRELSGVTVTVTRPKDTLDAELYPQQFTSEAELWAATGDPTLGFTTKSDQFRNVPPGTYSLVAEKIEKPGGFYVETVVIRDEPEQHIAFSKSAKFFASPRRE